MTDQEYKRLMQACAENPDLVLQALEEVWWEALERGKA